MPNNLVFNDVANQLKTQIYGTDGSSVVPISVDSSGNVSVTIANTANVSVVNTANVSVVNTANVSVVNTANVSVVNTANVSVVNTANVSVVNTANVSVVNKVTTINDFATAIANVSPAVAATGVELTEDTSGKMMYSYYVNNGTGSATVVAYLEVSPTTTDEFFINDSSAVYTLAAGDAAVLVPKTYLNYTRLAYSTQGAATIVAYYNAQS